MNLQTAATLLRRATQPLPHLIWGLRQAFGASPGLAASSLLLSIGAGLAPVGLLLAIKAFAEALLHDAPAAALPDRALLLLTLLSVLAVGYLCGAGLTLVQGEFARRTRDDLLNRLIVKTRSLPISFFDDRERQNLLHRARADSLAQPAMLLGAVGGLLRSGLLLLGTLVVLAHYSLILPAILIAVAIVVLMVSGLNSIRAHRLHQRRTTLQRIAAYLLWLLTERSTVPELRAYQAEPVVAEEEARLRDHIDRSEVLRTRREFVSAMVSGSCLLLSVAIGTTWMLGAFDRGQLQAADLVVCFYAFIVAHRIAGTLLEQIIGLYRGGLFLADLRQVMDWRLPNHPQHQAAGAPVRPVGVTQCHTNGPDRLPRKRGREFALREGIRLRNVTFTYPGMHRPALEQVSLFIPAGQVSLLTGANGAGKSTVLRLIAGLYQPDDGEILIDGEPLSRLDLPAWQASVSMMFPSPLRYPGSVESNIGIYRHRPAFQFGEGVQEIIEPLKDKLPQQLKTLLYPAPGGVELSSGQWQRIALARAVVRGSPLVLLDEPTAALDRSGSTQLMRLLEDLPQGTTTVLTNHQLDEGRDTALRVKVLSRS